MAEEKTPRQESKSNNDSLIYVFDSTPLMRLASGFPFRILSTINHAYDFYRRFKSNPPDKEKLINIVSEELKNSYNAGRIALNLVLQCLKGEAACAAPVEVRRELEQYGIINEIRQMLKLIGPEDQRLNLVYVYNKLMHEAGRGNYDYVSRTIPTWFFEMIMENFDWRSPLMSNIYDHEFRRILGIINSISVGKEEWAKLGPGRELVSGLSRTDKLVLAYTAYLNTLGKKAVVVIGDYKMKKMADILNIPYIYIYDKEPVVRYAKNLGNLKISKKKIKRRLMRKNKKKNKGDRERQSMSL